MRKRICLLALLAGIPLFGQGKFSVMFDGTSLVSKPKFFGKLGEVSVCAPVRGCNTLDLNEMKAKSSVFPGVEFRLNQKGRVTLGVSYQRWELQGTDSHSDYVFISYDSARSAVANTVIATVYINMLTSGRVRPFVGLGAGANIFDVRLKETNVKYSQEYIKSRKWTPAQVSEEQKDMVFSATRPEPVAKGVVGLNVFPVKNLVLSVAGGYINGPALSFGAGATF